VALEILGSGADTTHQLRIPATSSAYLVAQLRAAVPGIAVEKLADFTSERWRTAVELRRRITDADLAIGAVAAVSRTILAATTGLRRRELVVWKLVVGGGVSELPPEQRPVAERVLSGASPRREPKRQSQDTGVVGVVLRLGAAADSDPATLGRRGSHRPTWPG
jgi:hypothetical protein